MQSTMQCQHLPCTGVSIIMAVLLWHTSVVFVSALPAKSDPIAVAIPSDAVEEHTREDVENMQLEVLTSDRAKELPQYILDLNDPDISGPVEYVPSVKAPLSVISWDLLPPNNIAPDKIGNNASNLDHWDSHNIQKSDSSNILETTHTTVGIDHIGREQGVSTTKYKHQQNYRGTTYYTNTSPISTTTRATRPAVFTTSTTTTRRPTTTTTRRIISTTSIPTKAPITPLTTTTAVSVNPDEIYKLEAGDSYTLPPWLIGFDDPDLDVAVTYVAPTDLNEYNATVETNTVPPLEPFVDLKNINWANPLDTAKRLTPPYATTTTTLITTTTRRPTASSTKNNWVHDPTVSTIISTSTQYNTQFTSNHVTPKPASTTTFGLVNSQFNTKKNSSNSSTITRPSSTKAPFSQKANVNVFFQDSYNTGHVPKPFSRYTERPSTVVTTTASTLPTSTPTPPPHVHPFNAGTIPSWLADFDYPDVGPGVPFVYDTSGTMSSVSNDLLPPPNSEQSSTEASQAAFVTSSTSYINSLQSHQPSNTYQTTPASSLFSSPSKNTLPLPSINKDLNANTFKQPPIVFIPPPTSQDVDDRYDTATSQNKKTSNSFNKNFTAPFESFSTSGVIKSPLSTDQEIFPPLGNINSGAKTSFSKSDDGKVITNNVFFQVEDTNTAPKPFDVNNNFGVDHKDNQAITTGGVTSSSSSRYPQGTISTGSGKYTGGFGGTPGVLGHGKLGYAVQPDGTIRDPDHTYRPPAAPTEPTKALPSESVVHVRPSPYNAHKYRGGFGGPPGVLSPYDNIKNAGK